MSKTKSRDLEATEISFSYDDHVKQEMASMGFSEPSWRLVSDNESYVVTDCGRMFSMRTIQRSRTGNIVQKHRTRELNFSTDRNGYKTARIMVSGRKIHAKVHRLVAKAFIANDDNKPAVNHRNGLKLDNCAANLEWVTPRENLHHAIRTGLWTGEMVSRGIVKKVHRCDYLTIYILHRELGIGRAALAKSNNCSRQTIDSVIMRAEKAVSAAYQQVS